MPPRSFLVVCSLAAAISAPPALLSTASEARGEGPPRRIVSLDLCSDQVLLELAPRERIAAVTHLAGDATVSAIPAEAQGIPITHGD